MTFFSRVRRTILDVGRAGSKPEPRATHVVDLMPWETRGRGNCLSSQCPMNAFTKSTWFQADFLKPDFSLPFAQKSFRPGRLWPHGLKILLHQRRLLREMQRVAVRGVIEFGPSRISEQTMGIRDRESVRPGHPQSSLDRRISRRMPFPPVFPKMRAVCLPKRD